MKISITDLSVEDRPREKFELKGAGSLSKAELLAILIGSGNADENAVQLMQRVLADCNESLAALGRMDIGELCRYKGLGKAKAITLLAACELNKRRMAETSIAGTFDNAQSIYRFFLSRLQDKGVEESHVLLLNQRLGFISSKLVSRGGITGTIVDVRVILKEAVLCNATHIALAHNHPSGNLTPSRQDNDLTKKLAEAASTLDIKLIDHLIVTDRGYYSYHEEGLI